MPSHNARHCEPATRAWQSRLARAAALQPAWIASSPAAPRNDAPMQGHSMKRAHHHHRAGHWPKAQAADRLVLAFDERHRRRIVLPLASGAELLLDLPRAVAMADGDGLLCDDGGWIKVEAAPEPLYAVTAENPHLRRGRRQPRV